jgi:hypothetical protein
MLRLCIVAGLLLIPSAESISAQNMPADQADPTASTVLVAPAAVGERFRIGASNVLLTSRGSLPSAALAPPDSEGASIVLDITGHDSHYGARGALIGGIAGGLVGLGIARLMLGGPCDDTDAHISCRAWYVGFFTIGAVPGAIVGVRIGRRIPQ